MTAASDAAVDAFRGAFLQAGGPIGAEDASIRAGLEAAAPLLVVDALRRVHTMVLAQISTTRAYEGPRSDAGDALDWVLQRIDEELGR